MWDSKLSHPLPQKKLTQDLVAGNPKSVIRQKMGLKACVVLMHLKRAAAALTPTIPGMHISGLIKKIQDHNYCIRIKTILL